MRSQCTVFLVDDDAATRDALSLLLSLHGYRTRNFADGATLLAACDPEWCGCLLIDVRMPDMDGLTLQQHLRAKGCRLPVIIMTGHGDVETARQAFRADATDFLEKPIDEGRLVAAIAEGFAAFDSASRTEERTRHFREHAARLTPREHEVLGHVVAGKHNREIAAVLGISPRTVEVHKARVMEKLNVRSVPELVRLTLGLPQ